jgi:hypothetical protein
VIRAVNLDSTINDPPPCHVAPIDAMTFEVRIAAQRIDRST